MATTYSNSQIGYCDANNNVTVIYPYTKAANVEWSGSINGATVTNVGEAISTVITECYFLPKANTLTSGSVMFSHLPGNSNVVSTTIPLPGVSKYNITIKSVAAACDGSINPVFPWKIGIQVDHGFFIYNANGDMNYFFGTLYPHYTWMVNFSYERK